MTAPTADRKIVHLAPTLKRLRTSDVMCGCVGPQDEVSLDPKRCTCQECLDWITAPTEAIGAGVTGHD
jgi:hypothetical protein